MMVYRPALVLAAASVVTIVACSDPAGPGGDGDTTGSGAGGTTGAGGGSTSGTGGTAGMSGGASGMSGGASGMSGGASGMSGGASGMSGGAGGNGSGGSTGTLAEGPCDVLKEAGNDCVAAYSTIRRLQSDYTGPLYQLRVGSSAHNIGGAEVTNWAQAIAPRNGTTIPYQTTPQMGTLVDVTQTADGFGDSSIVEAQCPTGTVCTVSKLYDQSGNGNDMMVAKAGRADGGDYAALDDVETVMNGKAALKVGGHDVHSLYMDVRQGYRMTAPGQNVPLGTEAEGMYLLADGTHSNAPCCWDFGNVTPNPKEYAEMNTLLFGEAWWGNGNADPPWFGADFEAGVWMGGSKNGDPGWGDLDGNASRPPNPENPSMKGVKFALGFLKTNSNAPDYTYALSMADVSTATDLKKAYEGPYPKSHPPGHKGAIVLGVGGDNSNNAYGNFYEGAVYKGYPSDETETAVLKNIQAIGYGQ